jgi:hypothetical protein
MSKQVSFSTCTIMVFPMILGDNPACASGVPVTLSWHPVECTTTDVELYDFMRASERRRGKAMIIPVSQRAQLVIQSGSTMEDVADVVLEMDKIRHSRADSFATTGFGEKMAIIQEQMTKLPRGFLKVMRLGKPKQNTLQARSA